MTDGKSSNGTIHDDNMSAVTAASSSPTMAISEADRAVAAAALARMLQHTDDSFLDQSAISVWRRGSLRRAILQWRYYHSHHKEEWKQQVIMDSRIQHMRLKHAWITWHLWRRRRRLVLAHLNDADQWHRRWVYRAVIQRWIKWKQQQYDKQLRLEQASHQGDLLRLKDALHTWKHSLVMVKENQQRMIRAQEWQKEQCRRHALTCWHRWSTQHKRRDTEWASMVNRARLFSRKRMIHQWRNAIHQHKQERALMQQVIGMGNHGIFRYILQRWRTAHHFYAHTAVPSLLTMDTIMVRQHLRVAWSRWRSIVSAQTTEEALQLRAEVHCDYTRRINVIRRWKQILYARRKRDLLLRLDVKRLETVFAIMREAVRRRREEKEMNLIAIAHYNRQSMRHALLQLQWRKRRKLVTRNMLEQSVAYHRTSLMSCAWYAWGDTLRLMYHERAMNHAAEDANRKRQLKSAFRVLGRRRLLRLQQVVLDQAAKRQRLRKVVETWRAYTDDKLKEYKQGRAAVRHRYYFTHTIFFHRWQRMVATTKRLEERLYLERGMPLIVGQQQRIWRIWRSLVTQRQQERTLAGRAALFWQRRSQLNRLHQWMSETRHEIERRAKLRLALSHWSSKLEARVFLGWDNYARSTQHKRATQRKRVVSARRQLEKAQRLRLLLAWRDAMRTRIHERTLTLRAINHHSIICRRHTIHQWYQMVLQRRETLKMHRMAQRQWALSLAHATWNGWSHVLAVHRRELQKQVAALRFWSRWFPFLPTSPHRVFYFNLLTLVFC
jgi:hypothetical protein